MVLVLLMIVLTLRSMSTATVFSELGFFFGRRMFAARLFLLLLFFVRCVAVGTVMVIWLGAHISISLSSRAVLRKS